MSAICSLTIYSIEIKTLDDVKKFTDNTVMILSTIYEKRDKKGSQSK